MSEAFAFEGGATETVVRAHASELIELGARYGVTEIRFASTGRLLARIDHSRYPFDPFCSPNLGPALCGDEET